MAWRDEIRQASFRGVAFAVVASEPEIGRRTVLHEYPLQDTPYAEDLGRKARQFTLECLVLGAEYMRDRDRLVEALEAPGPGKLVHPYLGEMTVAVVSARGPVESTAEGGMARFTVTFSEAGENKFPQAASDTRGGVRSAAGSVTSDLGRSFETGFDASGPEWLGAAAARLVGEVVGAVQEALGAVSGAIDGVEGFKRDAADLAGSAAALIRTPGELAERVSGLTRGLGDLVDDPLQALRAYRGLSGFEAGRGESARATPSALRAERNRRAVTNLVRAAAVTGAAEAAARAAFASADEAYAARDFIVQEIDRLAEEADDPLFLKLMDLRAKVVKDIAARGANLARLVRYEVGSTLPAVVVAYNLYGDARRAAEIVARNRSIRRPGFVPGGRSIEVLGDTASAGAFTPKAAVRPLRPQRPVPAPGPRGPGAQPGAPSQPDAAFSIDTGSAAGQAIHRLTMSISTEFPNRHVNRKFRQPITSQAQLDAALQEWIEAVEPFVARLRPRSLRWCGGLAANHVDYTYTDGGYGARKLQFAPGTGYHLEPLWFGIETFIARCQALGIEPTLALPHTLMGVVPGVSGLGQSQIFNFTEEQKVVDWALAWQQYMIDKGAPVKVWDVSIEAFRPSAWTDYLNILNLLHPAMRAVDPDVELGVVAHDGPDTEPGEYNLWMSQLYPTVSALAGAYWQRHLYTEPRKPHFGGGYADPANPDHVKIMLAVGNRLQPFMQVNPQSWGGPNAPQPTWLNEFSVQFETFKGADKRSTPYTWLHGLCFAGILYKALELGLRVSPHCLTNADNVMAPPNGMIGGVGDNGTPLPGQRVNSPFMRPHGLVFEAWSEFWSGRRLTLSTFDDRGLSFTVQPSAWGPVTTRWTEAVACLRDDGKIGVLAINRSDKERRIGLTLSGFSPAATIRRKLVQCDDLSAHNEVDDRIVLRDETIPFGVTLTLPRRSVAGFLLGPA